MIERKTPPVQPPPVRPYRDNTPTRTPDRGPVNEPVISPRVPAEPARRPDPPKKVGTD